MYTFIVVIISLVVGFALGNMFVFGDEEGVAEPDLTQELPKTPATGASARILTGKMRIPVNTPEE